LREKIEFLREKRRNLIEYWTEILSFSGNASKIQIPEEPPLIFANDTENRAEIIYEF